MSVALVPLAAGTLRFEPVELAQPSRGSAINWERIRSAVLLSPGMRLSSLLLMALVATAGCGPTPPRGAAYPEALSENSTEGAPESAANTLSTESASQDDHRRLLAGVSLTAIGVTSAGMGGFLMGWPMGACDAGETTCAARVALPIVGALSIAGGAIPMAFGVSLLAPWRASAWPEVSVGPSAASATWRF